MKFDLSRGAVYRAGCASLFSAGKSTKKCWLVVSQRPSCAVYSALLETQPGLLMEEVVGFEHPYMMFMLCVLFFAMVVSMREGYAVYNSRHQMLVQGQACMLAAEQPGCCHVAAVHGSCTTEQLEHDKTCS